MSAARQGDGSPAAHGPHAQAGALAFMMLLASLTCWVLPTSQKRCVLQ